MWDKIVSWVALLIGATGGFILPAGIKKVLKIVSGIALVLIAVGLWLVPAVGFSGLIDLVTKYGWFVGLATGIAVGGYLSTFLR